MLDEIDIFYAFKGVNKKIVWPVSMYEDLELFSLLRKKISYLRVEIRVPVYILPRDFKRLLHLRTALRRNLPS